MPHKDLIVALGDTRVVADHFGVKLSAVSNWKARGVPRKFRPRIARMARYRKIELPADFMAPRA